MKWQKTIGWTLPALAIFIIVAAIAVSLVLRSNRFHEYAIRKITEAAEQATGAKTQVRALELSVSTLTVHLYDITMHGTEGAPRPPLLHADELTVSLKIQSLLRRKVSLTELLIVHPAVNVHVDRDGKTNLPQAPTSQPTNQTSSQTTVFDLAVRHLLLTSGEVTYNDKKTPMDADLYNLGADIHYNWLGGRYSGSVAYDNGDLHYAQYAPLSHSLHVDFEATPTLLTVQSAVLKLGSSVATIHAKVDNYSHPNIDGDYSIRLHTQDFSAMSPGVEPAGDVVLTGLVHSPDAGDQPRLRVLTIDGAIASDGLFMAASSGASSARIETRKIHGTYRLANDALHATNINLETLGGVISADLDIQHLDSTPSTHARVAVRGISLQAAQRALRTPQLRQVSLSGILDGSSDASWTGNIQNIRAVSNLNIRASAKGPKNGSAATTQIPVQGVIHLTYDGPRNAISLRSSVLRIPSASVTANGEISDRSNLEIETAASDLHELTALLFALGQTSSPPIISGTATFNATVHGSLKKPDIIGELNAENLKVQGSAWRSAHASLEATPSLISVSKGTLTSESAQRGRANFSANVTLRDWSYLAQNAIKADFSVQQMSVADLEHLANANYPMSGELSATIALRGSQLEPAGSGTVQISNGTAYGEPIQKVALKFSGDRTSIKSSLNVALSAGSANADLSFTPKTKAYTVRMDAPGISLQKLHFVQAKNLPVSGTLTASIDGAGTLDNPQGKIVIQLPKLTVRDKSVSGLNAELSVADQKASFNMKSEVVDASVQAHGQVNLTGDYYAEASVDTTAVPLATLLATYVTSLPEGFKGQTELHATLKGPLKDKTKVEAHLTIPTLNASYPTSTQPVQIGIASPIRADYANSIVTLQPSEIHGNGASLRFQGNIPLAGNSPANFSAQGSVDLHIAEAFVPDLQSSGSISLDIHGSGSASQPNINGQLRLQNVAMIQPGAPVGVEKLNGTLNIDNERIYLSGLSGQVGGGQLTAGGSITYRPSVQFNVAMQADSIRLRYPQGLRAVLNGNLALTGTKDASILNGRVLIDSLSFTPDFDLSSFADQFSSDTATPAQPGFADTVQLSIALQSQDNLSATSSQVSLAGSVNLRVGGTAANPVITGRSDLTSGELFYRNVRYELQRGIITFQDPNQTLPVLDVSVSSTVEQYNLTLNLRGPFDKLTTSYVSDPPLATADIINLLATGQTTSEASASQSTDSMIASQAAGQLSGGVQKLAGLSSLQIDPLIGGSNQNPSARIAIQQRVTKNFLFTFSTDVSQPGSEIVQGDYQINKRWSVSVARQETGGVSTEGRLHTRF